MILCRLASPDLEIPASGVTYDRSRFTVSKDISLVVGETFKRSHAPKSSIIGIVWNQNALRFLDDIKWSNPLMVRQILGTFLCLEWVPPPIEEKSNRCVSNEIFVSCQGNNGG